jgi:alpha-L-rhamnosidase
MRILRLAALSLVITFASAELFSQSTKPLEPLWKAQWITHPGIQPRGESILVFRKLIALPNQPESFSVDVSADSQFILYVNGQRVGSGPSHSDLWHWRYERYDIARFLHSGNNVLAAIVWNFGTRAEIAQMTERTAFLVHGETDNARVADTDLSWQVALVKGVSSKRPDVSGYYAAEPGERFDGRLFNNTWNTESSTIAWEKPVSLGRGSRRDEADAPNNWQLVPDPLPPMEMKEVPVGCVVRASGVPSSAGFPENEFTVPAHANASVLIDNGVLTTGYPQLQVDGGVGARVQLTYAEALIDGRGEKGDRNEIEGKHIAGLADEFLPSGMGESKFMPLAWRTWRYLQIDIQTTSQPLRVKRLRTWFSAYPFTEAARFESNDKDMARIWEIGWRTARLDAHDTYMDTPYWERLQYIGDTRIQGLISYTVAGDDRLARQAIEAFNNSRIPEGLTQSRYPSTLTQIIPTFSLLWIGMVHDFWMYREDTDFVRAQVPGVRSVLDWFLQRQRADGLLRKISWWPFLDWGEDFGFGMPPQDEDGGSAPLTLQFVEALRYAEEIESELGDKHQAEIYRAAADRARQAVLKLCWNEKYQLLADTPAQKHFSQHANILGVWLDVIPQEKQKGVLGKILSTSDQGFVANGSVPEGMTSATYYFRFYLARAMEHAGMGDRYLELLGPWKKMIALGLTTWAEAPEPTRSDSHAWSAHPNYDLLTIVAGIRPKTPGFKEVSIEPHMGNLTMVNAAMPTAGGIVQVEYKKTALGIEAQFEIPAGIAAELIWLGKTTKLQGKQRLNLPLAQ